MIDADAPIRSGGLPQWYLNATSRKQPRFRNPGRRGVAADLYAFPVRSVLEAPFRHTTEYRRLRYAFDRANQRLARLESVGASSIRIAEARTAVNRASAECASFLLRNLPQEAPASPVALTRELSAEGTLESESETAVP